jgi:signal transduction histidine kinase
MSIIPYLIFEKQKFRTLIFCCIPAFVSFTFLDVFMQAVGMRNPQLDIPGNDYQLMQIRGPIAYAIINGGCFIFQAVIAQGDEFNQRILGEVNLQASQIKEQYEKLVQSQQELNEMNLNLERLVEERTRDIRIQNHKLRGYAFSNAHHVRGPVARVLGLIQLSKMQLDIDRSWVFEKVESETLEIDRITRRITAELDASEIPDV